jgi:hypothetical protein
VLFRLNGEKTDIKEQMMANTVKYDIPRNWRKWNDTRIQDFAVQTYQNNPNPPEEVEWLIDAMWEELDTRDEERDNRTYGWEEYPEPLDMPSYAS